jgi:ribosomal protein S4E
MKNPIDGLDQNEWINLKFKQLVNVINGKHIGKSGKVFHVYNNGIIDLEMEDGKFIAVDKEDIDYKFESIDAKLFIPPEKHAGWDQRIKELMEDGYSS